MGRILPLPTEFILLKRNVKLLMLHFFGLEVPECCLWISNKGKPPLFFTLCHFIKVPCCSPLPEAKDGVEPSFQDLQSDTFPLCYPAKPATSCAKVKRLFFLPRSLFFYICGRSTLYDRRRVTREEGTTSFSLAALLHFPFLIESRKPLHYWYRGQKVASSICSGKEHLEASFCLVSNHA